MSRLLSAYVTLFLHVTTSNFNGNWHTFEPAAKSSYSDCNSTNNIHTFTILTHCTPLQISII